MVVVLAAAAAGCYLLPDRRPGYNKPITIHRLHSVSIEEIHHESSLSYVRVSIRRLICGLIFFVFCAVFSSMIFAQHANLIAGVPLGANPNRLSWHG